MCISPGLVLRRGAGAGADGRWGELEAEGVDIQVGWLAGGRVSAGLVRLWSAGVVAGADGR